VIRVAAAACVVLASAPALAGGLRLRGDALATTHAPAGLLVLEGSDRTRPWLDAEALVWMGAGGEADADALVIVVELRDPARRGSLRLGRQVVATGALRPIHLDGAAARVRLPARVELEAFGGVPVVPGLGPRGYDWAIGGRGSRRLGDARVGVAWMQRRDRGALATHEVGADGRWSPERSIDVAASAAWDVADPGLASLDASAAWWRRRRLRVELFASQRSPSHLLPATSLFSVLGDVPARRLGTSGRWRAAPRLDLRATAAARVAGGELFAEVAADAHLRLDERGTRSASLELLRRGAPDGGWTGARATATAALGETWSTAAEVELVVPDRMDRGAIWPWALGAVTYRPAPGWELAAAIEASASPEVVWRVDGLARLTRSWEAR